MSKQYLDIEQMQHLQELGVDTSKATFCVNVCHEDKHIFTYDTYYSLIDYSLEVFPVFALQDILDLLPSKIDEELALFINKDANKWRVGYTDVFTEEIFEDFSNENFIDAAYETLCWCVENGYIKTEKV